MLEKTLPMLKITKILALIFAFGCTQPQSFDVLIKNGNIYDGSGNPPFSGDIGINADTIAAIGDLNATAKNVIDAKGQAVAPGFINMLSWANTSLIEDGRSQSDIRQGVTLEVMGEGRSMGPLNEAMKEEMVAGQNDIKYDIEWTSLGEYLQYLEKRGVSTNIASFVGNGTVRQHVIGYDPREATDQEITAMKRLVEEAMEEGAVGFSSSLLYAPSGSANTDELVELAKSVSKYNGMYISHIRDEGQYLLEAIDELITIAKEGDLAAEIYHLKASGDKNWHKLDSAISMIESARQNGLNVTADIYTYPASSTGLHVQFPEWTRSDGVDALIARLKDPVMRKNILEETEFELPPSRILIVGFRNTQLRKHIGKRLSEVAEELGKSPKEAMADLIIEDNSRVQVVYFSMSEENIAKKIQLPWVSFCSDAGSYSAEGVFLKQSTHPRAYGSFIRVLGKYSRMTVFTHWKMAFVGLRRCLLRT